MCVVLQREVWVQMWHKQCAWTGEQKEQQGGGDGKLARC